jgi:hypothetical protein
MFKRIIYFLVFVFSLTLTSCKKVNDHKVKFEIEFIEDCQYGYSNNIDVICKPHKNEVQSDIPYINKENIKPGFVWKYEYWELHDGDKVLFTVMPQQGYHFIMKVYLDDKLVSYREVITGYGAYCVTTTIDIWGINNEASSDSGIIEFVYSE